MTQDTNDTNDENRFPDKDGGTVIDGSRLPSMRLENHDGDPVREAINRVEWFDHVAVGEVDGYDVMVTAQVSKSRPTRRVTPRMTVRVGGEWDAEEQVYLGGSTVSVDVESVWDMSDRFGELCREHGLLIVPPEEVPADG